MIGEKIKLLRKSKNLSLRALAGKTRLSHSFICDVEHGRCNPSIDSLRNIASALDVKPEFFLSNLVADNDLVAK